MAKAFRLALFRVALAAMLLRAVLPAGWMPDATAHAPLVICTMNGPVHLGHAPAVPAKHQPCPFATAAHLALGAGMPALSQLSPAPLPALQPPYWASAATALRHNPQSLRGPPAAA